MTNYKRFDESVWAKFGKGLLNKNDPNLLETQTEFLQVCLAGKAEFLNYLNEHLYSQDGAVVGDTCVLCEHGFSENEFCLPPPGTQKIIWDTFKEIDEEMKFLCGFWAHIIVEMLKNKKIEPSFLAARPNGGPSNPQGQSVIDEVLQLLDKQKTNDKLKKKVDDCVRRVLRSMCNPEARGKRIVFYDFHMGKSYWCWHWAHTMSSDKMHSHLGLSFEQVLDALSATNYPVLSAKMHTGRSYISAPNNLGGLLLFLTQAEKLAGTKLRQIIDRLSYMSAWKAIELQTPTANQQEIQNIANNLTAEQPAD